MNDQGEMVSVPRALLIRAIKADASIGSTAVQLVDGWNAMKDLRSLLAQPVDRGELLPCPFCGEKAEVRCSAGPHPDWFVECRNCLASAPVFNDEKLEGWNLRAVYALSKENQRIVPVEPLRARHPLEQK